MLLIISCPALGNGAISDLSPLGYKGGVYTCSPWVFGSCCGGGVGKGTATVAERVWHAIHSFCFFLKTFFFIFTDYKYVLLWVLVTLAMGYVFYFFFVLIRFGYTS